MTRLLCFVAFSSAAVCLAEAAPVPVVVNEPGKDREGYPLPKDAVARLGSLGYRGVSTSGLTFSTDGKRLFAIERVPFTGWEPGAETEQKPTPQQERLHVWDAETGRILGARAIEPAVPPYHYASSCIAGDRIITLRYEMKPRLQVQEFTVKVIVSAVSDLREICQFEFSESQRRWLEFAGGGAFSFAAVSQDGTNLALVSFRESAVCVYNLDTGKLLYSKQFDPDAVPAILISPDSKTLFIRHDKQPLARCELRTGKQLPAFPDAEQIIECMAVSSDGKRAVTAGYSSKNEVDHPLRRTTRQDPFLVVRDLASGKATGQLPVGGTIHSAIFCGADAVLVTYLSNAPFEDRYSIARWNVAAARLDWMRPLPRGVTPSPLIVSPDQTQFALAGSHVMSVFDAATGKPVLPLVAHSGPVKWAAFSPDGKTVTTAGGEEVMVWAANGERKRIEELPELSRGRGSIPTGLTAGQLVWASRSEDGAKTELVGWDFEKSRVGWRLPLPGKLPANVYSHDGKRVLVLGWDKKWEDWQAAVYDGPKGKLLNDWTVPYLPARVNAAASLMQLANQSQMGGFAGKGGGPGGGGKGGGGKGGAGRGAKGGGGGGMGGGDDAQFSERLRELAHSVEISERMGPLWNHPMTLSSDGATIFVAGNKVVALDAATGRKKLRIDLETVAPLLASEGSLAAAPDGARLAVASTHRLVAVEVETSKKLLELTGWYPGAVMRFSPDGSRLAVMRNGEADVSVYDVSHAAKPHNLVGGVSAPTCCAFSPNGASLVVGYEDGTSLIWGLPKS